MVVEISATLFQPARSGSHLYSAPLYPVRSRTLSSRSYMTLVGQPLLSGCLASLICILIISHFKGFVKRFFTFFFNQPDRGNSPTRDAVLFNLAVLLTPLLYHTLGDLSRRNFENFFLDGTLVASQLRGFTSTPPS